VVGMWWGWGKKRGEEEGGRRDEGEWRCRG
jgi:hypothetical protein